MWTYHQRTGDFFDPQGQKVATGYSGNGEWKNDPASDGVKGHGPIPRGRYSIIGIESGHGGFALVLDPDKENDMKGRSGFLIHGDMADPKLRGTASEGCIIVPRLVREAIWQSPDHRLEVVE